MTLAKSSRSSYSKVGNNELEAQIVKFGDKTVLTIRKDGEMDTTFKVKAPSSTAFLGLLNGEDGDIQDQNFSCEKHCIVGDANNFKIAVLVNQIAKLLYTRSETNDLIITLSSKLFYKSTTSNEDRDVLLGVLGLVGTLVKT